MPTMTVTNVTCCQSTSFEHQLDAACESTALLVDPVQLLQRQWRLLVFDTLNSRISYASKCDTVC